jgi:hypothetical protein
MNATMFDTMRNRFAQRLCRLREADFHPKSGVFNVDELAAEIEGKVDGTEDTTDIIVRHIPREDRRLREVMVSINHVLADCPSPLLFGDTFTSDDIRVARYELIAALMTQSGFLTRLLADSTPLNRFERWKFPPASAFFSARRVAHLNEQFISCFARRLVCFYGAITDVRVPNRELRDNFARSNSGMTTEHLLQKELGMAAFNAWTV